MRGYMVNENNISKFASKLSKDVASYDSQIPDEAADSRRILVTLGHIT